MPALIGPSQSTLSDHCYGFRNTTSEPLATPKTIPVWKGLESSSNDCHLPSRHRSKYDRPDEHYSYSLGSPTARREGGSPWSEPDSCETSPPSFFPPSTDSYYQYSGPQAFGVGDSQWHAPDYASHLDDYPTPQSNLSLSPPQQARGHIGRSGRYVAPSGSTTVKQEFGDIPPFGIPFPQPLGVPSLGQPGSPYQHDVGKQESLDECDDSDEDGSAHGEPPYAQLIFRALRSAPGHAMVLKDIYRWFEKNTDKAKKGSTGWQNSIRHNLSMNGGFRKVDQIPPTDDTKRGFIWVLEPSALVEGIKSTTRYRKPGSNKKNPRSRHPAPERQRSGAKGGKAARKAAKIRRSARFGGSGPQVCENMPIQSAEATSNDAGQPLTPASLWMPDNAESFFDTASRSLTPQTVYDYGEIDDVTSMIPEGPLFADDGDHLGLDGLAFSPWGGGDLMPGGPAQRLRRI